MMLILVKNISSQVNEQALSELFSRYGKVASVKIIRDRQTLRSKGLGYIEMENHSEGIDAVKNLNGSRFCERTITCEPKN